MKDVPTDAIRLIVIFVYLSQSSVHFSKSNVKEGCETGL